MSLISPAYAQAAGGALGGFDPGFIVMMVAIMAVMYFIVFRPQQKKAQQQREKLSKIKRGDRVITGGGIIATVTDTKDDGELQVEIASGVRVRVLRQTVTDVLAKTEPRGTDDGADKAKKEKEKEKATAKEE